MEPNNFIPCSHGERRETCIQNLPDVIIFEILLLLPGNILYNVMRYVCRNWYKIIEDPLFVSKHHMLSPTTLLDSPSVTRLCEYRLSHGLQLLDPRDPGARRTGFEVELPPSTDGDPALRSSCNGLFLIDRDMSKEVNKNLYVGNPVTRRIMPLPPLAEFMHCSTSSVSSSLAFAASSKAYKVLVVYKDLRIRRRRKGHSYRRGCSILTVGIDKAWREQNLTHLNEDDMKLLAHQHVSTTGIIYWEGVDSSYILALDVESECIKRIQLPSAHGKNNYILRKENSISFWHANPDLSMEVWVLKDHITGEWVKFLHIESEPIIYAIERFSLRSEDYVDKGPLLNCITVKPTRWLENVETIILDIDGRAAGYSYSMTNRHFVFDLKARTCSVGKPYLFLVSDSSPFINSLAWI